MLDLNKRETTQMRDSKRKEIVIYTDGACSGNPGPGGYGTILIYGGSEKELSEGFEETTNNRMELLGAITGLEALKYPCDVQVYSDSQYLVRAMNEGWAVKWRLRGWMRDRNKPALNSDLWARLLDLCDVHNVSFFWVRGHASNEYNNRCDALAVDATRKVKPDSLG